METLNSKTESLVAFIVRVMLTNVLSMHIIRWWKQFEDETTRQLGLMEFMLDVHQKESLVFHQRDSSNNNKEDDGESKILQAHQGEPLSTSDGEETSPSDDLHVPFFGANLSIQQTQHRADRLCAVALTRRTIRFFDAERPIPRSVIQQLLLTAGSAPSGAHKQRTNYH
jgi:hypothetical protein